MSTIDKTSQILDQLGLSKNTTNQPKKSGLGQDAFLKLMMTQMNNQDPLQPMQNGEFLTQMAQFTSASGIQGLQKSFDSLAATLTSNQALQASTLVGRSVLVPGSTGVLSASQGLRGAVTVPESTGSLKLNIYDANGQLVRHMDMGAQPQGQTAFTWNGVMDNGSQAAPGQYTVRAETFSGGNTVAAQTLVAAGVDSVTLGGQGKGVTLNLAGLGQIDFSKVKEIM